VTTHREGGGASSRSRPRSPPAAASAAGFGGGGNSKAPRIRRREQVAETPSTGRETPAVGGDEPREDESRGGRREAVVATKGLRRARAGEGRWGRWAASAIRPR